MSAQKYVASNGALGLGRFWVSGVLVVLAGCSLTPEYRQPATPVPETLMASAQAADEQPATSDFSMPGWEQVFADPQLQTLIATGLEQNRDLRVALLNVEAARAQYRLRRSDLLPSVGLYGEGLRSRVPSGVSATGQSETQGQYGAGGLASYEVDLFGRLRGLSDQALQQALATGQGYRSARISLISEIASAYLSWVVDTQLLALAERTRASRAQTLALVERQFEVGVATRLDLSQAKVAFHEARSRSVAFGRLVQQDLHALQLLTGSSARLTLGEAPAQVDSVVQLGEVPAHLPSSVLLRRPDVMAAEHEIRAAEGNIGAARAAFFPRIVLTGTAGTASGQLSDLFDGGSGAWSFLPRLDIPIFDFGRRKANLERANVERDIRLARYEEAIQKGFREVSDALVARRAFHEQLEAEVDLVQEAERSHVLSMQRYEKGVDSFLQVLDAQRTLFNAQQALLATRLQQQMSLVMLYRSLGGSWGEETSG